MRPLEEEPRVAHLQDAGVRANEVRPQAAVQAPRVLGLSVRHAAHRHPDPGAGPRERLPTEPAIVGQVRAFAALRLQGGQPNG